MASPSDKIDDKARKMEYKNLIKEKILRPSKSSEFSDTRGHHSHLVIRDSHYLIKMPTSFITCSACHRGRVLKISSIQDLSTHDLLTEIYSSIGKNPCTKRKQTPKEPQDAQESYTTSNPTAKKAKYEHLPLSNEPYSPIQPNTYFQPISNEQQQPHQNTQLTPLPMHQGGPVNVLSNKLASSNSNFNQNHPPINHPSNQPLNQQHNQSTINQPLNHPPINHASINYTSINQPLNQPLQPLQPLNQNVNQPPLSKRIPNIEDFLNDFEEIQELPNLNERLSIKSIGSTTKVSGYTLSTLFNGLSSFPTSLDLSLSLSIEADITNKFYTNDTLIIPLPAYSSTMFMKDFNKNQFLSDENLTSTINKRIVEFIMQPNVSFQQLKIVIIFNYFQEGVPERPHENQSHKYVGNIYVINRLNVLQDSSLTFTNSRYTFNHNFTWVDPKEEWIKVELFNDLIIKPLQNEIIMKYHQDLLGNHIHSSVLERGSNLNLIPYTVDESFLVTSSSSLYVVNFISLKILRVLCGIDGLQMISYLLSVQVNTRHNLHLLKLLLDRLKEQAATQAN